MTDAQTTEAEAGAWLWGAEDLGQFAARREFPAILAAPVQERKEHP